MKICLFDKDNGAYILLFKTRVQHSIRTSQAEWIKQLSDSSNH